jgi:hypothetical protein
MAAGREKEQESDKDDEPRIPVLKGIAYLTN